MSSTRGIIESHPRDYVVDVAPQERWNLDLTTNVGGGRILDIFEQVKNVNDSSFLCISKNPLLSFIRDNDHGLHCVKNGCQVLDNRSCDRMVFQNVR